jgi:hypothetical protein
MEATASLAQAYDDAVGDESHGDRARTAQREFVECSDNAQVPSSSAKRRPTPTSAGSPLGALATDDFW